MKTPTLFTAAIFAAIAATVTAAAPRGAAPATAAPAYGPAPIPDGKTHKLALHDGKFWIDNTATRVVAGEMHPGRIQPEFWEDRIKKARAMGLNTVSVYLFWHQMEPKPGEFSFEGITDIRRFVKLCQDNGLWVILRVGPYVCAETEFGGYPAWLLKDHSMRLRADDPKFLNYNRLFVERLAREVADLQINHGGPIILTQFENELGAINPYLRSLHDIFVKAGFDGQLMTCDHSGNVWNTTEGIPGVLRGYNGIRSIVPQRITEARKANAPGYPVLTPEFYTGWFDLWGGDLAKVSITQQVNDTKFLLDNDVSFTLFCVNGGTNFGYTAGSNAGRPMQTTYDYDAPIDELGRTNAKYKAIREVLTQQLHLTLPPVPPDPAVITIPPITLTYESSLLSRIGDKPIASDSVKPMEDFDQSYGFILYRTKLTAATTSAKLHLPAARDYAMVLLNGAAVADGLTAPKTPTFDATITAPAGATLDILVENMGRTSSPFDQANSRKGLEGNPTLDGKALTGWQVYTLPLNSPADLASAKGTATTPIGPSVFSGTFNLTATGETYLDLSNFHFGIVWVNGHNLGRFWDIGSCRSLYLPSTWQKKGANQITALELGPPPATGKAQIAGTTNMVVTRVKPIAPFWITAAGKPLESVPGQGDDGSGLQ